MWWFLRMLLDERGDGGDAAQDGQGAAPAPDAGQGAPPADGGGAEDKGGVDGQGDKPPEDTAPMFGEFGDTPKTQDEAIALAKKLYDTVKTRSGEYETLKGKVTATERNMAAYRKALEGSGIRAVKGDDGNIKLEVVKEEKPERKARFTDSHKSLWDDKVLDSVQLLIQDKLEEFFETREKTSSEKRRQMQAFVQDQKEIEETMLEIFPMLNPDWDEDGKPKNKDFNEAFFNRSTEIWEEEYRRHPLKQLAAARRAAKELKVFPQMVAQAEKTGFEKGKTEKRILGPIQGSGQKGGAKQTLSKEEYLKLTSEEKEAYDKKSVGLS